MTSEDLIVLRVSRVVHPLACRFTACLVCCNSEWFAREFGVLIILTLWLDLNQNLMRGITANFSHDSTTVWNLRRFAVIPTTSSTLTLRQ